MTSIFSELCILRLAFFCAFDLQSLQRAMAMSDRMVEHSTELKRAKKKTGSLESELKKAKLALAGVD